MSNIYITENENVKVNDWRDQRLENEYIRGSIDFNSRQNERE